MPLLRTDLDTQHKVYMRRIDEKLGIRFSKQSNEEKENIGNWPPGKFSLPNQVSSPHRQAVFKTQLPVPYLIFSDLIRLENLENFRTSGKGETIGGGGWEEVYSQDTKPVPILWTFPLTKSINLARYFLYSSP